MKYTRSRPTSQTPSSPILSPYTTKTPTPTTENYKQCLINASYITLAQYLSPNNLIRANIDSKSRSILATPIDNFRKSKSTTHNQSHQVDLILPILYQCASFHVEVNASMVILLINPLASSTIVNVWYWRPSLQKEGWFTTHVHMHNKFHPWRPAYDSNKSTYGMGPAFYHHPSGVMISFLNNTSEYPRVPQPITSEFRTNKLTEYIANLKVDNN